MDLQPVKPNGHKPQTAATFFGQSVAHNVSGSSLDLSDADSRDDEESLSGNPIEEDEVMSLSDMDPFALSSSYSSETDGTDAESRNELDGASVAHSGDPSSVSSTVSWINFIRIFLIFIGIPSVVSIPKALFAVCA